MATMFGQVVVAVKEVIAIVVVNVPTELEVIEEKLAKEA